MIGGRPRRKAAVGRANGRWVLVGTLALTETTSYGVLSYAFGVFLLPMQHELGWSRTALTGAYALAVILSGVAAVPVGRWLDRNGARALMTVGACAATLLVLAWAHVSQLILFYAIWAGIGITMAAVLYEPAFAVIASSFRAESDRNRALLSLTVMAGFASVIYVPLAGWLVEIHGWRDALTTLAVLLGAFTILPSATLPGRRPGRAHGPGAAAPAAQDGPARVALQRALHDKTLWWLAASFFAATLATTTVTVHLVAYLREHGYSAGFAATWTGFIGAMSVTGRVLVSVLGRRFPLTVATAAIFGLQAFAVVILVLTNGPTGVIAFVVLFGVGVGLISLARAALVADFYGVAAYATINGVLALLLTIARAGAPVAAAALRTVTGSYQLVLAAVALASVIASIAMARAQQLHSQQVTTEG